MAKKKKLNKKYNPSVEACKSLAFQMIKEKKHKIIPDKSKFNKKKERRKKKIKIYEGS